MVVGLAGWSFVSMFGGRPVFAPPHEEPAPAERPASRRETSTA